MTLRPRMTALRASTVTVSLQEPLCHAGGAHWAGSSRTITA